MNKNKYLSNHLIETPYVLLVDPEKKTVEKIATQEAIKKAQEMDLDLVAMNDEETPTCKILNYKNFIYEQKKKTKENKQKAKLQEVQEIRITPVIGSGDLNRKIEQVKDFLRKDAKVRLVMFFKTRRSVSVQNDEGQKLLQKIAHDLQQEKEAIIESDVKNEGRRYVINLAPVKGKK